MNPIYRVEKVRTEDEILWQLIGPGDRRLCKPVRGDDGRAYLENLAELLNSTWAIGYAAGLKAGKELRHEAVCHRG